MSEIRQTSLRIDEEVLRQARYILDRQHTTMNQFIEKCLHDLILSEGGKEIFRAAVRAVRVDRRRKFKPVPDAVGGAS